MAGFKTLAAPSDGPTGSLSRGWFVIFHIDLARQSHMSGQILMEQKTALQASVVKI